MLSMLFCTFSNISENVIIVLRLVWNLSWTMRNMRQNKTTTTWCTWLSLLNVWGHFSHTICQHILLHRWEVPSNHPVFSVVLVIYHYNERIWRILVAPYFLYNIYDHEFFKPGAPVNINIQLFINVIQENNRLITTKKG